MKKLFLLPAVAMFALVGCGQQPAAAPAEKKWQAVTAQPVAGTNYRLVLDRSADTAEASGGLWYLKDQNQQEADPTKEQPYYLMTDKDVANGAAVEVKVVDGGFTVKIGARYLFLGLVGTYTNSLLKDTEAEATVLQYDLTNGFGVTLSEKFWGLGTRNDRSFTTVGAVNFTQYPNNFKTLLYEYK